MPLDLRLAHSPSRAREAGRLVDLPGPRGVRVALEVLVGPVDPAGRELEL